MLLESRLAPSSMRSSRSILSVVREVVDTYRPLFERLEFALVESLPRDPVFAVADRDAISQALVNLFQNSIKYSDRDKHVTIALSIDGEEVRVLVADRGIGIPMVDQARIFDRYYRVRSGPTGPQGSGLGLSIVKHVVDAHGGRLEVQSTEAEGSDVRTHPARAGCALTGRQGEHERCRGATQMQRANCPRVVDGQPW